MCVCVLCQCSENKAPEPCVCWGERGFPRRLLANVRRWLDQPREGVLLLRAGGGGGGSSVHVSVRRGRGSFGPVLPSPRSGAPSGPRLVLPGQPLGNSPVGARGLPRGPGRSPRGGWEAGRPRGSPPLNRCEPPAQPGSGRGCLVVIARSPLQSAGAGSEPRAAGSGVRVVVRFLPGVLSQRSTCALAAGRRGKFRSRALRAGRGHTPRGVVHLKAAAVLYSVCHWSEGLGAA